MNESKTTAEPLAVRIAHALADRRPRPSSDFEARLERAGERTHLSLVTGLLAAAVLACAMLLVLVERPPPAFRAVQPELQPPPGGPPGGPPAPALPHDGRFGTDQCNNCHGPAPAPPTVHELNGGFPLVGGHRSVACAACHTGGTPPVRSCLGCHSPWRSKPK